MTGIEGSCSLFGQALASWALLRTAMINQAAPQSDLQAVEQLRAAHKQLRDELAKVIVGQDHVLDQLLMAIFCRGHALLMGVPGLAKTLMVSTLAQALDLTFKRIQFTPDLMPTDITGTEVIQDDPATRQRMFKFLPGPVFANIVLADEINRTPPRQPCSRPCRNARCRSAASIIR